MSDLTVALDPPYWIRLRPTFREAWSALREEQGHRPWLVVADRHLLARHPRALVGLTRSERGRVVTVRGGEASKSLRTLERLVRAALDRGLDRRGLVIALGGGTVGDVTGFFAASYQRGVAWSPLATTVLAMADSAVGGKTGVNLAGLKNLVGAFHQPVGVFGALEALTTLPRRHRVAGTAEIVKSAMIADADLFETLEARADDLSRPDSLVWMDVLSRTCAIKAAVVARDPVESRLRAQLNFGHTLGHALEATAIPRPLHGEAVALGMIAASLISEWLAMAPKGTARRLERLLERLGLPTEAPPVDMVKLFGSMRYDKKSRGGEARMVLTAGIGSTRVDEPVDAATLRRAVRHLMAPRSR